MKATMFQRCSAVSCGENDGIAVPVTPTEILRNIMAGVTSATADALPIAGGFGEIVAAAGPSPIPRGPWQDAQLAANNRSPAAASSGRAGSSSAASLPSDDANRLASAPSSEGGRLAVTARMIE